MNNCEYNGFFEGKTALVSGGAGFIGSHLTQHLTALGCEVRVLDDFSTGHESNIQHISAECIEGSILDEKAISTAIRACDIVFHLAAFVSVPMSMEQPKLCHEINVLGTENVVRHAEAAACRRVVFASTAGCYGSHPNLPSTEHDSVSLESPYVASKYQGEQCVANMKQVDGVSLRYFNVFGARQDPNSTYSAVVCAFQNALENNQSPLIFGDGSQTRDFTPVENIVHANLLAGSYKGPLRGEVFNVGTGNAMSLIEMLQAMLGTKEVSAIFKERRDGDILDSCADITAITQKLGYQPVLQTQDALQKLVNPTLR